MKSKKYIEFKENYLPEYYQRFYEKTYEMIESQKQEWNRQLKKQMERVLENIAVIQEKVSLEIGCIQVSLLLSSIEKGEPELMYEVYDSGMEFGTLLLAQTERIDWLFTYWQELKEQIVNKISELKWERYLREEAVKALMYEGIDGIILLFTYQFKYDYAEFPTFLLAEEIKKTNVFYVSVGEYRGWRKILYQYVEEKDIFQELWEKDFSFMKFHQLQYQKKRFAGQKLTSARFKECIFLNTTFNEVDLMDVVFENCVFRECVFTKCQLNGCEFRNCDMQRIKWKDNKIDKGLQLKQEKVLDVCRPTRFYHSILHKHTWKNTKRSECLLEECDIEDMWEEEHEIL